MPPKEKICLDPEGKQSDYGENSQCRDHEMTDDEYAIYHKGLRESEEFLAYGVVLLTTASEIEESNNVAHFAINYFNHTQGANLQFVKVIKWMVHAGGPLNHFITFIAMENSTGATKVYQAKMHQFCPWEESEIKIFREKPYHQIDEADEIQCLAIFAVHHYNKTKKQGEDLKYIEFTTFERLESSHYISFKAENMLTGNVQIYETKIVSRDPIQNSVVKTFRKSPIQWTNRDEELHFFTNFAIDYYNKTEGEQLKLVQIVTCDQHADSYHITFKARDILTSTVEHYQTEVVSGAPEYNSMVKTFRKSPIQWTSRDEQFHYFTTFAINHYNKTEGEQLKLVQIVICDQNADSYHIAFKAKDILTSMVEHYQTEVVSGAPEYNSTVKTFRKNPIQWSNQDEQFHYFTTFAINHYNKTKGERLKLVQIVTCDQHADSYCITFKARDLLSCMVEHFQTEIVSAAPEYNSMVKVFQKILMLSANQDEKILFLTTFAIDHYNKTKGEHMKLVQIVTCDQHADSYYVTFKARDLLTCMVEHYQTEVVSAAPVYNSTVKVFKKILKLSKDQDMGVKKGGKSWTYELRHALTELRAANNSTSHHENVVNKVELGAGSSVYPEVSSSSTEARNGPEE